MALEEILVTVLETNNVILFLALIVLFVVAYRVLQAVINTAIVAVLSGLFLVALSYIGVGPGLTFNNVMLFAVLGTGFFILYSALATLLRTSSSLVGALKTIGGWIFPSGGEESEDSKEKRIVLQKVDDDE